MPSFGNIPGYNTGGGGSGGGNFPGLIIGGGSGPGSSGGIDTSGSPVPNTGQGPSQINAGIQDQLGNSPPPSPMVTFDTPIPNIPPPVNPNAYNADPSGLVAPTTLQQALADYMRLGSAPQDLAQRAKEAGTYSNTPEFQKTLNADYQAAVTPRANSLETYIKNYLGNTPGYAPNSTQDLAFRDLYAGKFNQADAKTLGGETPPTYDTLKGQDTNTLNAQLQNILSAYVNTNPQAQTDVGAYGPSNSIQQRGSTTAETNLMDTQLQNLANQYNKALGLPFFPQGTI